MGRTIKFVALSAFWYCVGIFLLAFTSNTLANLGFQGRLIERNTLWVWALIGAVASIAIGVANWDFSVYGHVRAVRHNTGSGPAFGNGWGDAAGEAMKKHGWLIAGFLLSIVTVWFGYNYHQTTADWIAILLLAIGAVLCFAQEFGKAGDFLGGWWKHGLPVTWFVLSIVLTATLWNDAKNGRIPFWSSENWMFWAALASLIASGITLFGGKEAWKAIGGAVGKGIAFAFAKFGEALFFLREKGRFMVGFLTWGILLFLSGVGLVLGRNLDLDFLDSAYEIQMFGLHLGVWMITLGFFFLIILTPLGAKFDIELKGK